MKKKQDIIICANCGYPAHPCLPCEEVIALNREDEDLSLVTNRHYNMAREALGEVHRFKKPDGSECGWVEVQNAIKALAFLYADLEHATKNRPLDRGFTIPVLDHGYVRYIDHMGSDERICEAARISYKSPSKGVEQDAKLLGYLWKNRHTSPFEQVSITYNIKLPLFVQGQMVRHRTQRLNQVSSRYTEMEEEFYIPKEWRKQDARNKHGSICENGFNPPVDLQEFDFSNEFVTSSDALTEHCRRAYILYKNMIGEGISREMARMVLPQNLYTEIYSNWDLNNLTHFFTLRLDAHAQWEIRQYAQAMYDIAKKLYPWTIAAYERYKWKLVDLEENK